MPATIIAQLDYCNPVLASLPRSTTEPLQDAAVRLIYELSRHERARMSVTLVASSRTGTVQALYSGVGLCHSQGQCPAYLSASVKTVATATSATTRPRSAISCHHQLHHSTTSDEVRDSSYLTKSDLSPLDFTINRFFVKLLRTNNIEIVKECQQFFNFKLSSIQRLTCCKNLDVKYCVSDNLLCKYLHLSKI